MNHCELYLSCVVVISAPPVLSGRNLKENMLPISFDIFDAMKEALSASSSMLASVPANGSSPGDI